MKLLALALLFAFLGITLGSIETGFFNHKDHPGKCVYNDEIFSPGDSKKFSYTEGGCIEFFCGQEDGFGKYHTCGVQGTLPDCKLGDFVHPDKPYPECCKRHNICP